MDAAAAFLAERQALRSTLEELGPDAPTLVPKWTARDIAPHIVGGELAAGVPVFVARSLVRRSIDVTFLQKAGAKQQDRLTGRGWDWALDRLGRNPPRLVHHPSIAPVSLFEYWIHHEDVRRANGGARDAARDYPALQRCVEIVGCYVGKRLDDVTVVVEHPQGSLAFGSGTRQITLHGPCGEVLLWLAGRGAVAEADVSGDSGTDVMQRLRL